MVHSFVDQQFVRNFNFVEIGRFCLRTEYFYIPV